MFHEKNFVRRRLALILASAIYSGSPAFAGREVSPDEATPLPAPIAAGPLVAANTSAKPQAPGAPAEADAALLASAPATPRPSPSTNLTINLINRLVARGLLPKEDADELIKQAEEETAAAQAQAAAQQNVTVQAAVSQALAAVQAAPVDPVPELGADDALRITYIPDVVKTQIRDEIRADVMAQARNENWAAPRTLPEWTTRIKLFGDIRVRGEGVYFPAGNDNTGAFPNFNAINTGQPFDISGTVFSPQLNVDEDRQRLRLRVRFGLEAELGNGFSAGIRLATGDSNSPTSTNQSLGAAGSGQGGNFSKYAIWLDRGFLKYEIGGQPNKNLALFAGRFDNPFFSTDIVWDDDIGFDGVGFQARYEVLKGFTPFIAGGAFPVFNTDFNFASNQPSKFPSDDKWLYGGQLGFDWKVTPKIQFRVGTAYYDFDNIEGKLSDPFVPLTASDAGNTDASRPAFAQKGNTYRPIRNIIPTADNDFGTTRQFQYFGLASEFRNLALTAKLDINYFEPVQISLFGEYTKNLAFNRGDIDAVAVNNRGPNVVAGTEGTETLGAYAGGDTAWIVGLRVGRMKFEKAWDWSLGFSYRYVESDAVVDGFTDSDFGGGGTNVEGFSLFGAVALGQNTSFGLRWMTSDEIAGPPLKVDTIQVEFNGKF
jgi:hypothetical protein